MKAQRATAIHEHRTIVDVLCSHAERVPDQTACRFFKGVSESHDITFRELWLRAAALAQQLRETGLAGERVLLGTTEGPHFVLAFFGCLMAGAIAVPAPPAGRKRLEERLRLLASDAQAKAFVGDSDQMLSCLHDLPLATFDCRALLAGDAITAAWADRWRLPAPSRTSVAFLQYTSGSTGEPKGVMVTHSNIIANCEQISAAMNLTERSKYLSVLPLFHDMGLVGGVLVPLFNGAAGCFLSPVRFVQHPEWWLQLVSRHRITTSGGPNFMFDLVANEVTEEQLQGVDLSSWNVAYCGAEPIRASTMTRFIERFAANGLQPSTFYPCYGMAEATLFITGNTAEQVAQVDRIGGAAARVGCGHPRPGTRIEIVDPRALVKVSDGLEGEVWVQGDTVAAGYWNRTVLTRQVFRAYIADSGDGPFLRTGDLGVRQDGQLYITGRLKDVIVVRGKKYAPQDIEQEVERSHQAIQPAGCAAFSVERDGGEALVVVAELRRSWLRRAAECGAILEAIGAAISNFQLSAAEIVLAAPHSIPRTSSGKLKRGQTRTNFLEGQLASVAEP